MNDNPIDGDMDTASVSDDGTPVETGQTLDHFPADCCTSSGRVRKEPVQGLAKGDDPGGYVTVTFSIRGMTCLSCAHKVEATLSGLSGVAGTVVDLSHHEAKVSFDPIKVEPDILKAAVKDAGYGIFEADEDHIEKDKIGSGFLAVIFSRPRPVLIGVAASLGVVGFYLGLLTLTSDWYNARLEFREYGLWILALALGLGLQATLFSLLRAWHQRGSMKAAKYGLAASGGMSTAAMAACCAHYLGILLPALGLPFLSAAAAGLAQYRTWFFLAGVLSNIFGIGLMLRMMVRNGMIQVGTLVIRNIAGVPKRTFVWKVE